MLRRLYRQAPRRLASYTEEALVYGNQSASGGSSDGKGNTKPLLDAGGGIASKLHLKAWDLAPTQPCRNTWHHAEFISTSSGMCASTASAIIRPSLICPIRSSSIDDHTKNSMQIHGSHALRMHPASLHTTAIEDSAKTHSPHALDASNVNVSGLHAWLRLYSSSAKVEEQPNEDREETDHKDLRMPRPEDNEEIMGFILDGDISAVANELRQAQQDMIVRMRRCSRVLFAVGALHLTWGGMMFSALESPLNHAVMTEVCMSTLVICGLAYQLNQTVKPVEFFANHEEHRRMRIIFLSRQVSRMLGAFFHRGYGIAFVLSLTLTAHALSCVRFLLYS